MMLQSSVQPPFDFEYWSHLATSDPQAFEARRAALIEAVIQRAPEHSRVRLRRLQWKLDAIRTTARNPLAACVRMHELMWQGFIGGGGLWEVLNAARSGRRPSFEMPFAEAAVLRFDPERSKKP